MVDTLKDANEKMVAAVRKACTDNGGGEGMAQTYADFLSEWVQKDDLDTSLVSSVVGPRILSLTA